MVATLFVKMDNLGLRELFKENQSPFHQELDFIEYFIEDGHERFGNMIDHLEDSIDERLANLKEFFSDEEAKEIHISVNQDGEGLHSELFHEEKWRTDEINNTFLNALLVAEVIHFEEQLRKILETIGVPKSKLRKITDGLEFAKTALESQGITIPSVIGKDMPIVTAFVYLRHHIAHFGRWFDSQLAAEYSQHNVPNFKFALSEFETAGWLEGFEISKPNSTNLKEVYESDSDGPVLAWLGASEFTCLIHCSSGFLHLANDRIFEFLRATLTEVQKLNGPLS